MMRRKYVPIKIVIINRGEKDILKSSACMANKSC